MSDFSFIEFLASCPKCGALIPPTVPAGRCPKCNAYLMDDGAEYPYPTFDNIQDYLKTKYPFGPDIEPESVVNIHTYLFAMFKNRISETKLFSELKMFNDAITRMDELGPEKTYEKIKHVSYDDPSNENLIIIAKTILDLDCGE